MKLLITGFAVLSLFLAACEDPAANKTQAIVSEPVAKSNAVSLTQSVAPQGEKLLVNPQNSKIEFTGSKVTGSHHGGFAEFTGSIDFVESRPEASRVEVAIDAASVFSDDEDLTKHLRSADFFDVGKFPDASFTSTKIEPDAKRLDGYMVTGDLVLHGVTKTVTFPATIKIEPASVGVSAEFAVNRKDFGIVYTGTADDLIRDSVVIKLTLNTTRNQ